MKRAAVIDLGTNTFNLLIAEVNSDEFTKVFSYRIPVMLGEGTIDKGFISEAAFRRGIEALKKMRTEIDRHDVSEVSALATSAIRSAKNGDLFIEQAKRETGISIQKISGEREAELIYIGNTAAIEMQSSNSLIMDIGGGSTEFIIANNEKMLWKQSFLLGAARLISKFRPEDPISEETIAEINEYFEQELKPLFEAADKFPVTELIGSSGAFDSFAELIDVRYDSMNFSEEKIAYTFNLEQYRAVAHRVIPSTLAERQAMDGLIPMRVEMIVISFIFVNFIIERLHITKMRSTTWSLKEGAIIEMMKNKVR